jgi:AraC family transcriptional regulator
MSHQSNAGRVVDPLKAGFLRPIEDALPRPTAPPPGWGTPRRRAVAHTTGVTTVDSETAPTTTQSAAPIFEGAADTRAHQHERRRKPLRTPRAATVDASTLEQSSRDLLVVTAELIEAACRARDGDSHGTRAHIARAVALLDGHPAPRIARQANDRGPRLIPRGGFAAWQSRRLAAHVDANLAGKIVIKDLAASLDITVGHFCRAFKRTFGMPASIWIRQRRIKLAQGLMLTTGASLSEIALSCGMSDQSHFTRSFRRIAGETPSSWRQTRHGAIEERVTEIAYPGTTMPIVMEKA